MECQIGVISGDGIGPEIVTEAKKVLDQIGKKYGHLFHYTDILMGGCSIDATGVPLTDDAIAAAKASDAVLMGSIGGNTSTSPWYQLAPELRPEAGLLKLRKSLNLFANLRPAYLYEELKAACPLRDDIIGTGFDMMIMRELTGGLYFGARKTEEVDGVTTATDTLTYNENEIRRIAKRGFDIAMKRRKKVTSVDKANVLDSSRLWRKIVEEVAKDYPEVTYEHMLVDNCAMQLVKDPKQFDVILTENMFGDILSDEASMVTGSIGMLSSASLNDTKFGLYEPSGGSAPDIAGKGIANPIATILSAAMMLRYTFDLDKEADFLASNLPYGKQRKLEIARALATNPKLLLLDEPAAGMNPNETKELMETIHFVRDEFDMTVLLIEHDMKLVSGICEELTVLNFGQVLAQGKTSDVLNDPQVIKAYLGE